MVPSWRQRITFLKHELNKGDGHAPSPHSKGTNFLLFLGMRGITCQTPLITIFRNQMEKKSQESNVHLLLKIPYCFFVFFGRSARRWGFQQNEESASTQSQKICPLVWLTPTVTFFLVSSSITVVQKSGRFSCLVIILFF